MLLPRCLPSISVSSVCSPFDQNVVTQMPTKYQCLICVLSIWSKCCYPDAYQVSVSHLCALHLTKMLLTRCLSSIIVSSMCSPFDQNVVTQMPTKYQCLICVLSIWSKCCYPDAYLVSVSHLCSLHLTKMLLTRCLLRISVIYLWSFRLIKMWLPRPLPRISVVTCAICIIEYLQ